MPSYLSEAGRCGGLHRGRDQMLLSRDRAAKTQLQSEYDASWASEGWELRRMLWQGLTDDGVYDREASDQRGPPQGCVRIPDLHSQAYAACDGGRSCEWG